MAYAFCSESNSRVPYGCGFHSNAWPSKLVLLQLLNVGFFVLSKFQSWLGNIDGLDPALGPRFEVFVVVLVLPIAEDGVKVDQALFREQTDGVNQTANTASCERSTRKSNEVDLVAILVIVAYKGAAGGEP